jgi:hypothetical protein
VQLEVLTDLIGVLTYVVVRLDPRHLALNLPRQDTTTKIGLKAKRFKASCSLNYAAHRGHSGAGPPNTNDSVS